MREKELMLTSILGCRRVDLFSEPMKLTCEQQYQYETMMARRKSGEPLQYIVGFCDFMGIKIFVDDRVLIPRPETEILVEHALLGIKNIAQKSKNLKILDLGTGSGNIAISLAKNIPTCSLTAVDVSPQALSLASDNARYQGVADQIDFVCEDMVAFLKKRIEKRSAFDVIISNPPYIKSAQMHLLPVDVQKEPLLAFDGGEDGASFYRHIIEDSRFLLREHGFLFLEIGDDQKSLIEDILGQYDEYKDIRFKRDYVNIPRVVEMKLARY